jgi:hypothetical protein
MTEPSAAIAAPPLENHQQVSPADEESLHPDGKVVDYTWRLIASVFSIVLVGSFITLAVAIFTNKPPDLLLTAFTASAGFLSGLLAPNPSNKN